MEYRTFGRTGAKVSRVAFGGAVVGIKNYLGTYDPENREQKNKVLKAMDLAFELGINYFDTAQSYGDGIGEKIYGEGIKNMPRKEIFLATKISSSDHVRASVMESLDRLKTNYVDLIQIHGGSYLKKEESMVLEPGGVLSCLEQLKKDGYVKNIGFTTEDNNEAVYTFIRSDRFDVMQIRYNLISQHPYYEPFPKYDKDPGSMNFSNQHHMGICTMRTLTSGCFQKFMKQIRPDDSFDYNEALLQFNLSCPLVHAAVVGMRTPEEVTENVRICEDLDNRIDLREVYEK